MTNKEAIAIIRKEYLCVDRDCDIDRSCGKCDLMIPSKEPILEAYKVAIKALEEPSYNSVKSELDAISRQAVIESIEFFQMNPQHFDFINLIDDIKEIPSVKPQEKTGHCKDCKYFEYDSMAKVDGIPLIVAHEICSKWGDGCKTKEDGYCFLFEPQEGSDKE